MAAEAWELAVTALVAKAEVAAELQGKAAGAAAASQMPEVRPIPGTSP